MNDRKLRAKWSKREGDVMIYYPDKRDGAMLSSLLSAPTSIFPIGFLRGLEERGYDLTTLKFEITKKELPAGCHGTPCADCTESCEGCQYYKKEDQ